MLEQYCQLLSNILKPFNKQDYSILKKCKFFNFLNKYNIYVMQDSPSDIYDLDQLKDLYYPFLLVMEPDANKVSDVFDKMLNTYKAYRKMEFTRDMIRNTLFLQSSIYHKDLINKIFDDIGNDTLIQFRKMLIVKSLKYIEPFYTSYIYLFSFLAVMLEYKDIFSLQEQQDLKNDFLSLICEVDHSYDIIFKIFDNINKIHGEILVQDKLKNYLNKIYRKRTMSAMTQIQFYEHIRPLLVLTDEEIEKYDKLTAKKGLKML